MQVVREVDGRPCSAKKTPCHGGARELEGTEVNEENIKRSSVCLPRFLGAPFPAVSAFAYIGDSQGLELHGSPMKIG